MRALRLLWLIALSVGSAVGVVALTVLTLFTFAQVVDVVPFGTAFFWANLGVAVSVLVAEILYPFLGSIDEVKHIHADLPESGNVLSAA